MIALLVSTALAGVVDDVNACLDRNDVGCAKTALAAVDVDGSAQGALLAAAAQTSFHAGEYERAHVLMDRAVASGWTDKYAEKALYERTATTMAAFAEERRGRYIVRYRPGLDAVLLDDVIETVRLSELNVASLLGGSVPGPVIVEVYPDGRSFIDCSSLSEESVKTTGVVALSKWSRLLVTSPRALGRGYGWKDTVAHEFIHEVISHRTDDQAPVWMQEAIAKYLDNRWVDGKDHFRLSPRDQALLGEALREDAGQYIQEQDTDEAIGLVPFKEMHPSLALLSNANRAGLAYAQLSSLMSYVFLLGGDHALERVLPEVKSGVDPRVALARGAGARDFDTLLADWKGWVKKQKLVSKAIAPTPTVLDGGEEAASDPVMSKRQDLVRWIRLGDRLSSQGHPTAALIEYAKALPPDEPASPMLANRIARARVALGDFKGAKVALQESLVDYPEYAETYIALAQVLTALGQPAAALDAWRHAGALNPFDLSVQQGLMDGLRSAGDTAGAARHERYLTLLKRGGPEKYSPIPESWTPAGDSR